MKRKPCTLFFKYFCYICPERNGFFLFQISDDDNPKLNSVTDHLPEVRVDGTYITVTSHGIMPSQIISHSTVCLVT